MFLIYAVAMGAFGAMTPAFRGEDKSHRLVYLAWYGIAFLEAVFVVTISCNWRMLSFKKTHLMERMSLLTIIVIGEGAIGVTKTVGKLMSKQGLDLEGCFLIMCIIIILVSLLVDLAWHGSMLAHICPDANIIFNRSSYGPSTSTTSPTGTTARSANKSGPFCTSPSSSQSSA
jgi:hypothetical protein